MLENRASPVLFSTFVIPSEVEEWSEWGERHGPLGREAAARESGDERIQSLTISVLTLSGNI